MLTNRTHAHSDETERNRDRPHVDSKYCPTSCWNCGIFKREYSRLLKKFSEDLETSNTALGVVGRRLQKRMLLRIPIVHTVWTGITGQFRILNFWNLHGRGIPRRVTQPKYAPLDQARVNSTVSTLS